MDFCSILNFIWQFWGVTSGLIGFVASLRFKMLDSQPEKFNMGRVSIDVHDVRNFENSCHGFLTRYLSCVRPGGFQIHIFEVFGRNQKDARRKFMQIRGGITSGSALFDGFMPTEDVHCSVIFAGLSHLPVRISGD